VRERHPSGKPKREVIWNRTDQTRRSPPHLRDEMALTGAGHRSIAGVQLATLQQLAHYWTTEYDWGKGPGEVRLPALIKVRDAEPNHLPVVEPPERAGCC
jgi:hypothetical protein